MDKVEGAIEPRGLDGQSVLDNELTGDEEDRQHLVLAFGVGLKSMVVAALDSQTPYKP